MSYESNNSAPIQTVITTQSATLVPTMVLSHGERSKKFTGIDFKRWQQKMLFYLKTLSLAKFLTEDDLRVEDLEPDATNVEAFNVWKSSDFMCKNYILNGLDNSLYNVYCTARTSKELWTALIKSIKTKMQA